MMSFGSKPDTVSVLVPDHTHWGNEGGLLTRVSDGKGITGWEAQYSHLKVRCRGSLSPNVLNPHERYHRVGGPLQPPQGALPGQSEP